MNRTLRRFRLSCWLLRSWWNGFGRGSDFCRSATGTAFGLFLAMYYFTTYIAYPAGCDFFDNVAATEDADHLALIKHRQALDTLMYENMACLLQFGVRGDADDTSGHNITDGFAFLRHDIVLGNDTHQQVVVVDDR